MTDTVRFAELIEHEIGGGWGDEGPTPGSSEGAFVIRGTDIPRALVGDVSAVPYRYHKPSNLRVRSLRHNDIVFEVSGGSRGQPVGRALLVNQRLLDRLGEPTMCASFCKLIRLASRRCNPRYVFRRLQAAYNTGELDAYQVQSTGITNFRWKPFLDFFEIVLPDPDSQARTADILDSIDDLIENNRRRVEVLEEMARAIYREWFVHFRYPGHEHVPLVDSPLGPIPEGWRFGCVDDLVTLNKATVDPSTVAPSTPAMGLEHIPRRRLTVDDWGEAGALGSRKATFLAGDILFGKIRPYFHKVSVAPVDGICSTDAIVLRPHPEHWGQAVLTVASDEFVAHAVQTSNGTKMPRADWKVIREFPVAIPPSEMARRFSERAHALLAHAEGLMFQARHLASLRDLLLPKLVTGQIDVSHLDLGALTEAATA